MTLNQHTSVQEVTEGLMRCKQHLQTWSRNTFRNHKRLIATKLNQLKILQESNVGDDNRKINNLKREVDSLLKDEDMKWKQRAKQQWLKDGDRNTSFFHKCASQRRRNNSIKEITDENGRSANTPEEVGQVFQSFFQHLFTSSELESIEACIQHLKTPIIEIMNAYLTKEIERAGVEKTIFSMKGLGSLGLDGFPTIFCQTH